MSEDSTPRWNAIVAADGDQHVIGQDFGIEELENPMLGRFDRGDVARQPLPVPGRICQIAFDHPAAESLGDAVGGDEAEAEQRAVFGGQDMRRPVPPMHDGPGVKALDRFFLNRAGLSSRSCAVMPLDPCHPRNR